MAVSLRVCVLMLLLMLTDLISQHACLDNGLARTPPMGWMTWERFRCLTNCTLDPDECISEKLITDMADRFVADGYKDAGYEYISIDDCWLSMERDAQMRLQPDPSRFPRGIKYLADYLHARGLKLGIYEDFGKKTCGGYPGSEFYLSTDAETFAEWEVDMLKFDGCNSNVKDMPTGYPLMGHFLNKTGRPILYSCSWPAYVEHNHALYQTMAQHCNLWRNYDDIEDSWNSVLGIINYYGQNKDSFLEVAGPGNWNDPDQLIIGNFGLSYDQQRVQMGIWAIVAAPLFMSVDLRTINQASRDLLLNKRLLEINQDPLAKSGQMIAQTEGMQLWVREVMPAGSIVFAFLNTNNMGTPSHALVDLKDILPANATASKYELTEVFEGKSLGQYGKGDSFHAKVNPTGIYLVKATPVTTLRWESLQRSNTGV